MPESGRDIWRGQIEGIMERVCVREKEMRGSDTLSVLRWIFILRVSGMLLRLFPFSLPPF